MKNTIKLILLLAVMTSFGCSKSRLNRTITFYTTNANQVPAKIIIDGNISQDRQTLTLDNHSETIPVNCNESNNSVTINLTKGEHTIAWECDDNTEAADTIQILNDCYLFEIGD